MNELLRMTYIFHHENQVNGGTRMYEMEKNETGAALTKLRIENPRVRNQCSRGVERKDTVKDRHLGSKEIILKMTEPLVKVQQG